MKFSPDKDIPDLAGKVYIVTGGNSGLGYETILQLSKHNPAQIFCAARNATAAAKAIENIAKAVPHAKVQFLQLDLACFSSIKAAADSFARSSKRLDCLINNGGIMACPPALTQDGYEIQFGTNYMGHALLTKLLIPLMLETAQKFSGVDVSIINLSSSANEWAPIGGLVLPEVRTTMEKFTTLERYGQSKLANILHAKELARLYSELRVVSVHPGAVDTGLGRGVLESWPWLRYPIALVRPFISVSTEIGVCNQLWASTSKEARSGEYYCPVGKLSKGHLSADHEQLQKSLWNFTEKQLAQHGY